MALGDLIVGSLVAVLVSKLFGKTFDKALTPGAKPLEAKPAPTATKAPWPESRETSRGTELGPVKPPAKVKLMPVPPNHVPYSPPPPAVQVRAKQLLRTLGLGQGVLEHDPTGTWESVFYRKEPHAGGRFGVSAWRHVTHKYTGPR